MAYKQTFAGDGLLLHDGNEYPCKYKIVVQRTAAHISADGDLEGIEPATRWNLQLSGKDMRLRLHTGDEVEVAFLGGNPGGPCRFVVNSRMPGF